MYHAWRVIQICRNLWKGDEINEEYIGIVESFEPGFQEQIESATDDLILGTHRKVIAASKGYTIDPRNLNNVSDIKSAMYDDIISYDGLEEDLQTFQKRMEKVEKVRNDVLQAAYS